MFFNENIIYENEKLISYINGFHSDQIKSILFSSPSNQQYDILPISISDLIDFEPSLWEQILISPSYFLIALKKSVIKCQEVINQRSEIGYLIKYKIQFPLINIPFHNQIYINSISQISEQNYNQIIIANGTVVRVSNQKLLEKSKIFQCTNCQWSAKIFADPQQNFALISPDQCTNLIHKEKKNKLFNQIIKNYFNKKNQQKKQNESQAKDNEQKLTKCNNTQFQALDGTEEWSDIQEIKIQEPFKTLKAGDVPKTINCILEGFLVGKCKPGDDIQITAILFNKWKNLKEDSRPDLQFCLYANQLYIINKEKLVYGNLEIEENEQNCNDLNQNSQYLSSSPQQLNFNEHYFEKLAKHLNDKNEVIQSVCPNIFQNYDIKLSVLLCLIGGITRISHDTRIRGQIHILLVGEPGTGKSTILKEACKLSNRAVFANAISTTAAGLTVSFQKENNQYTVNAGALVLSDLGICCIDEFNAINDKKSQFYNSILEVMEQQTISACKGDLTTVVNARASLIAACNPIIGQKYDSSKNLSQNTGLSNPLLSRFDIIFIMQRQDNIEVVEKNCDFILEKFSLNYQEAHQKKDDISSNWTNQKLKKYIKQVQSQIEPSMTQKAQTILIRYYKYLRQKAQQLDDGKVTIRTLESFVRLSQAHARLLNKSTIDIFDAISIIILAECAQYSGLVREDQWGHNNIILNLEQYENLERYILEALQVNFN